METTILEFTGSTKANLPPDQVLQAAVGHLETAVVVGWTKDGTLYVAGSDGDADRNAGLLSRAVLFLLSGAYED